MKRKLIYFFSILSFIIYILRIFSFFNIHVPQVLHQIACILPSSCNQKILTSNADIIAKLNSEKNSNLSILPTPIVLYSQRGYTKIYSHPGHFSILIPNGWVLVQNTNENPEIKVAFNDQTNKIQIGSVILDAGINADVTWQHDQESFAKGMNLKTIINPYYYTESIQNYPTQVEMGKLNISSISGYPEELFHQTYKALYINAGSHGNITITEEWANNHADIETIIDNIVTSLKFTN